MLLRSRLPNNPRAVGSVGHWDPLLGKCGRGLPHPTTLREAGSSATCRQALERGSPLPLFPEPDGVTDGFNRTQMPQKPHINSTRRRGFSTEQRGSSAALTLQIRIPYPIEIEWHVQPFDARASKGCISDPRPNRILHRQGRARHSVRAGRGAARTE